VCVVTGYGHLDILCHTASLKLNFTCAVAFYVKSSWVSKINEALYLHAFTLVLSVGRLWYRGTSHTKNPNKLLQIIFIRKKKIGNFGGLQIGP
jgi:hypothetical protein